jgi:mannose-6-phosphate isomerase-like protein (cupin superfamily)
MAALVDITAPGAGETLDVFGAAMVVKADPAQAGFFLAEHIVPPGYMVPPHVHDTDDEYFWVLDGELTVFGDNGESKAGPATCINLPHGSRHGFRNDGPTAIRFLVLCRPGLQAVEMFRHFDRAGRTQTLGPAEIAEIAGQYGVTLG